MEARCNVLPASLDLVWGLVTTIFWSLQAQLLPNTVHCSRFAHRPVSGTYVRMDLSNIQVTTTSLWMNVLRTI